MSYPENALVLNGVIIAMLDESTTATLLQLSDSGITPGTQYEPLDVPVARGDSDITREWISPTLLQTTPVVKKKVNLSIEFVRKGKSSVRRA